MKEFASQAEELLMTRFAQIRTKKDILSFRNVVNTLDEINGIFLRTADESSYWVLPLIQQFYGFLGIRLDEREILVVNDHEVNLGEGGYGVIVDLFNNQQIGDWRFKHDKKIDVFFLPRQSNFSISSMAVLAHEVGHVYFSSQPKIKEQIVDLVVAKIIQDSRSRDLFNNPDQILRQSNIASHIEEHFCDKVGHFLLGPIYSFSLVKILGLVDDDHLMYQSGSHPPIFKRLYNAKREFHAFQQQLTPGGQVALACDRIGRRYFGDQDLIPALANGLEKDEMYYVDLSDKVATDKLLDYLQKSSFFISDVYKTALEKSVQCLDRLIPPVETIEQGRTDLITPWEVLVGIAFYFSGNLYETNNELFIQSTQQEDQRRQKLKEILLHFLTYSINTYLFSERVQSPIPPDVMTRNTVWNLRSRLSNKGPFIVVPTIDFNTQYSTNAVDLRLGNSFITSKLTEFTHIPTFPQAPPLNNRNIEYFFEKHFIPFKKTFTLHPHSFVLAVTLEYICIPLDYYALVLGRSTWGRLGLNIATATAVGPGFKGCITLELRNLSEVPINLNVGTRICQICLIKAPMEEGGGSYSLSGSKYICPTEAEFPKIHLDPDWELLKKFNPPPDSAR